MIFYNGQQKEAVFMVKKELLALWDFIENCLRLALNECRSTLPSEDADEVIEEIDYNEFLLALYPLTLYFVDNKIKFSKIASKYIREAAIAMEINKESNDDYWLWEKIEPLLTDER